MSADNWTYCPKCTEKANIARQAFENKAKTSYGKVSAEEYLRLTEQLNKPDEREQTLREDYELGIIENKFYVSYRASCTACKFSFTFKEERAAGC
jgi:hypothetical protein